MRHHTLRTTVLCLAVVACVAAGTAVGVALRRNATEDTRTALADPTATDVAADGTAADGTDPGVAPGSGADVAPGAAIDGAPGEGAEGDDVDGAAADPAPPEGEERPPGRNPQVPDLDFRPIDPPVWNPNPNGNGNGNGNGNAQPPEPEPEPSPLAVLSGGGLGAGPIWETGGTRDCFSSAERTSTWTAVAVHEIPRMDPYQVTATARAGNTTVPARVEPIAGQPARFRVWYSFPRGSVREPSPIAVTVTVTNSQGTRATATFGGQPQIGHRLMPFNYCP